MKIFKTTDYFNITAEEAGKEINKCETREEAIEELHYIKDSLVSCELSYDALDMAIESLSADVRENVKGKWIEDAETYYKALNELGLLEYEYSPYFVDDIACSECLAMFSVIDNETQFFKYCPNCGADMRSQECNR